MNRDERAVAHGKRIAVKSGGVGLRGALGRDVGDVHEIRIERGRTGESEDLAGGVGADVGTIDAEIDARIEGVFSNLKEAPEEIGVEPSHGRIGDEIDVVGKAVEHLLHKLLSADVIEQFLVGAVLGHLPREKLVEGNAAQV